MRKIGDIFNQLAAINETGLAYKYVICEAVYVSAEHNEKMSSSRNFYHVQFEQQAFWIEEDEFEKYAEIVNGTREIPETAIIIPLLKNHKYFDHQLNQKTKAPRNGFLVQLARSEKPVFYSEAAFHALYKTALLPLSEVGYSRQYKFLSPHSLKYPVHFLTLDCDMTVELNGLEETLVKGTIITHQHVYDEQVTPRTYKDVYTSYEPSLFGKIHMVRRVPQSKTKPQPRLK
mgnify:CR=1 FL=1